jgi:hypothetical protein
MIKWTNPSSLQPHGNGIAVRQCGPSMTVAEPQCGHVHCAVLVLCTCGPLLLLRAGAATGH